MRLNQNSYVLKKRNIGRLYLFIKYSKNRLGGSLLYQGDESQWINPKLVSLFIHEFPSWKICVTLNLIFPQ